MQISFQDVILKHRGARVCIMGGSDSLADDVKQVNADLWISANEHGCKLRDVDYIVAMDHEHGGLRRPMLSVLREYSDAPVISPEPYADIRMHTWPFAPRRIYSGLVAAWVGWALGAKVVILAGMDSYNGTKGAVRKAERYRTHIPCEVRSVGGKMPWPAYQKGERFRYRHHPMMDSLLGKEGFTTARAIKPTEVNGVPVQRGEIIKAMRHDIRRLLRHGVLVEVIV